MIDELEQNRGSQVDIIDDMEGADADTTLAAGSSRALQEVYLNLKALYTNLAGIAFTGTKPTWQNVEKRSFTLSQALTDCEASITTGDAGSGKVYEGTVVIRLTPETDYAFSSIAVTKTSGGAAVDFERTDGTGYVDISFVCAEAVTITAVAVNGYGVALSSDSVHASILPASVLPNADFSGTITADDHFTLPQNITVKVGSTTLQASEYTYTRAAGNASATLEIAKEKINGNIEVTCEVIEDDHVVLDLDNVGTNIVVKQGTRELSDGEHLYNGTSAVTLTISPKSGYKHTSAPTATIGGSSASVSGSSVYGDYTLEIGTSVSADTVVAITAANATALSTFNIDTSGIGSHITIDNGTNNGSVPSTIQEGSALTIRLTPDSDYAITIGTKTMGNDTLSDPTNSNGVLTFSIDHVTGDIVISATAEEVVMFKVTKKLLNYTASDDATATTDPDFGYKVNQVAQGESYTTTLNTTATPNNDLKVYIGGVLKTAGTDYTFTNNVLTIPAEKITGDIVIVATAKTGTFKVYANEIGVTATLTFKEGNNPATTKTIECDEEDDGLYWGSIDGLESETKPFIKIEFSKASSIVKIDGGGVVLNAGTLYNSFFGTALRELKGLVVSCSGPICAGCSSLVNVETIGWSVSSVLEGTFRNCSSLVKIDVENILNASGGLKNFLDGCKNLEYARGIEDWDISRRTSIEATFSGTKLFKASTNYSDGVLDLSKWNTGNVTTVKNFLGGTYANGYTSPTTLIIGENFNLDNVGSGTYSMANATITTLKVKSSTPPLIKDTTDAQFNWLDGLSALSRIEVPRGAKSTFEEAEGWIKYKSIIVEEGD